MSATNQLLDSEAFAGRIGLESGIDRPRDRQPLPPGRRFRIRSGACGQHKPCPDYPRQPTAGQSAYRSVQGQVPPLSVATVDEGHSLSEHANPLGSVHANRVSGTTS
jgi:hypothetical protein